VVATPAHLRLLSAADISAEVRARKLNPVEVIEAYAAGLAEWPKLNALITPCAEEALVRAERGLDGPLAGVPFLVKDMFDTRGIRTTYGSRIYSDHVPARTAAAVRLLEDAGAVVVAKANLHEFAWGTTSQNPHYGIRLEPRLPRACRGRIERRLRGRPCCGVRRTSSRHRHSGLGPHSVGVLRDRRLQAEPREGPP
jgi:aspartyl-tRNA(Asn)/glutamyl-tRNA(Gln) amidotransferase subunit A